MTGTTRVSSLASLLFECMLSKNDAKVQARQLCHATGVALTQMTGANIVMTQFVIGLLTCYAIIVICTFAPADFAGYNSNSSTVSPYQAAITWRCRRTVTRGIVQHVELRPPGCSFAAYAKSHATAVRLVRNIIGQNTNACVVFCVSSSP